MAHSYGFNILLYSNFFIKRISDKPETNDHHEFFYLCDMVGGEVGTGQGPEFQPITTYKGKYLINWVNLKKLTNINLKPQDIKDKIIADRLLG